MKGQVESKKIEMLILYHIK